MARHAFLLVACAACTTSPPPTSKPPPVTATASATTPAPVASAATSATTSSLPVPTTGEALLAPAAAVPPWNIETPPSDAPVTEDLHPLILARGERSALVSTYVGVFVVGLDGRVAGPLQLPEPAGENGPVLGLGRGDEIIFVGKSGQLYSAASVHSAMRARAAIAGASHWDFAGTTVVAAKGDTVHISLTGGRAFAESQPQPGKEVTRVVARPDGVVLAMTDDGLRISKKGGRWKDSLLDGHPHRIGSWIGFCGFVLTSDGKHWAQPEWPDHDRTAWRLPFELGEEARGFAMPKMFTLTDPPIPKTPPGVGDEQILVGCSGPTGPHMRGIAARGKVTLGAFKPYGLRRIAFTLGPEPSPTTTEMSFLANGACTPGNALSRNDDHRCKPGTALSRAPQLLAVARDPSGHTATLLNSPPDCRPQHIINAQGLAVVTCVTATGLGVELTLKDGAIVHETDLVLPAGSIPELALAPDGGLAVGRMTKAMHEDRLLVRRPAPLAHAKVWREVRIEGAVAYRMARGGVVLALVAEPSADTFSLAWNTPERGTQTIAKALPVRGGVRDFEVDAKRRVVIHQHRIDGSEIDLVVTKAGSVFSPAK